MFSKKVTVEDVHNEFKSEVFRLLKEAKIQDSAKINEKVADKAERLRKLGFSSSKVVQSDNVQMKIKAEQEHKNKEKQKLIEAINFISQESVKKICEKYKLVCGEVTNYIGDIPEKNLCEIEQNSVADEDKSYNCPAV